MAMSAEHITGGNPPGADATQKFEVIEGSPEPFFNPTEEAAPGIVKVYDASFDSAKERFDAANKETYTVISEIINNNELPPDGKSVLMLTEGVGLFFSEIGIDDAVIDQQEVHKLLKLAHHVSHLGIPRSGSLDITRELMLEEIHRLTREFEYFTPLHAFELLATKSMRSVNERTAKTCALALRIWVLEHSHNSNDMPSHYDRLRYQYLA